MKISMMMGSPMQEGKDLTKIIKGSKITDYMAEDKKEEEDEMTKKGKFRSIHCLVDAACELYCDGEMGWDEVIGELSSTIAKLKGKEKEL